MGGYILNREGIRTEEEKKLYRQGELELMTTCQLREICRRERIVRGLLDPLDKEELIHVIMRYRGTREQMLILEENDAGNAALERLLSSGKIAPVQDRALHIPSRIVVYKGLSMDEQDGIFIPYRSGLEDTNALLVSGMEELCGIFYLQKKEGEPGRLYVKRGKTYPAGSLA